MLGLVWSCQHGRARRETPIDRTHHHDGTGALVAHALDRGEIGLPVVRFDAVIEPDFDAKVGEQGGVLCKHRAGQENVGSLKVGRGEQDGEDEVEGLPNTVSLTRASVAVAVSAVAQWRAAYQDDAVLVVLDVVPALVVIRDGFASRRGADTWDVTVVTLSVECFACGGDRRGRRRV